MVGSGGRKSRGSSLPALSLLAVSPGAEAGASLCVVGPAAARGPAGLLQDRRDVWPRRWSMGRTGAVLRAGPWLSSAGEL